MLMRISSLLEWSLIAGIFAMVILAVPLIAGVAFPQLPVPAGTDGTPPASPGCSGSDLGGFYQDALSPSQGPFIKQVDDFTFTLRPLYSYRIVGRIMGKDEYGATPSDRLAPVDLTIASGDIIRPEILSHFSVYKYPRHFSYSFTFPAGAMPLSPAYVAEHISNNHLIFANDAGYSAAKAARVGDMVEITGYLVTVYGTSTDGRTFSQTTSTTRRDQGEQSCEVVYVETFRKYVC